MQHSVDMINAGITSSVISAEKQLTAVPVTLWFTGLVLRPSPSICTATQGLPASPPACLPGLVFICPHVKVCSFATLTDVSCHPANSSGNQTFSQPSCNGRDVIWWRIVHLMESEVLWSNFPFLFFFQTKIRMPGYMDTCQTGGGAWPDKSPKPV